MNEGVWKTADQGDTTVYITFCLVHPPRRDPKPEPDEASRCKMISKSFVSSSTPTIERTYICKLRTSPSGCVGSDQVVGGVGHFCIFPAVFAWVCIYGQCSGIPDLVRLHLSHCVVTYTKTHGEMFFFCFWRLANMELEGRFSPAGGGGSRA